MGTLLQNKITVVLKYPPSNLFSVKNKLDLKIKKQFYQPVECLGC